MTLAAEQCAIESHKVTRMREHQRRQRQVTVRRVAMIGRLGLNSRMSFQGRLGRFARSAASLQFWRSNGWTAISPVTPASALFGEIVGFERSAQSGVIK